MDDRELLELAAKAAGYPPEWHGVIKIETYDKPRLWNPLTDDGDAFRLAVRLQMQIDMRDPETHLYVEGCAQRIDQYHKDNDPYAATRRAIVRAAAEIGRAM